MARTVIRKIDGMVVNVIAIEDDIAKTWDPGEDFMLGPDGGNIGETWDGSKYLGQEPPTLPIRQAGAPYVID